MLHILPGLPLGPKFWKEATFSKSQIDGEDFVNFRGLLRNYELQKLGHTNLHTKRNLFGQTRTFWPFLESFEVRSIDVRSFQLPLTHKVTLVQHRVLDLFLNRLSYRWFVFLRARNGLAVFFKRGFSIEVLVKIYMNIIL